MMYSLGFRGVGAQFVRKRLGQEEDCRPISFSVKLGLDVVGFYVPVGSRLTESVQSYSELWKVLSHSSEGAPLGWKELLLDKGPFGQDRDHLKT